MDGTTKLMTITFFISVKLLFEAKKKIHTLSLMQKKAWTYATKLNMCEKEFFQDDNEISMVRSKNA